jgi:hypothetical protein
LANEERAEPMNHGELGRLDGLEICPRCRALRGPWSRDAGEPRVQECTCEVRRRPRGERNPAWEGWDVPMAVELCRCCGLVPLRSGSRWSVWLCDGCKPRALELNGRAGRAIVPIGRHSLMHGIGISGPVKEEESEEVAAFCAAANGLFEAIDRLHEWARLRIAFNVERLGFDPGDAVPLPLYLARIAASNDPDLGPDAAFEALTRRMVTIARTKARREAP